MKFVKPPIRFWIGVLVFLTTFTTYTLRVNLSISIIKMASKSSKVPECAAPNTTVAPSEESKAADSENVFDWDEVTQGHLLAAYGYGYFALSTAGGYLAENFGPYNTILIAHLIKAVLNSVSVWCLSIYNHWSLLFVDRLLLGLIAGVIYPALQCLIANWAPPAEKGRFVAALMGNTLGTAVTFPLVGVIADQWGWQWSFHFTSIMCLVFCLIFWLVGSNDPKSHKWISAEEIEYIATEQAAKSATTAAVSASGKRVPPYKKIFTSLPFWALNIAHFGNGWGLFLQVTGLAKFVKEVLDFDLKKAGFLSSLPFLLRLVCGFLFGTIGDKLIKQGKFSKNTIRKSFVLFSHFLPALSFFCIWFVNCDRVALAITLLTLAQGLNGAAVVTNIQNPHDLAPLYAGTIYGIINTFSGLTGFLTPMVTGALTNEHNGLYEWKIIFMIGGFMYGFCGLIFVIFGTAELQSWNKVEGEE